MATEAEIRSINRYNKANTVCVNIRLNKKTDADIIEKLDKVSSKMGYIKDLIRKDMLRSKQLDTIEAFLQGKVQVVFPKVLNAIDFLHNVERINSDIKLFDGHAVTDWYPCGCYDYFYMWVELKDGVPILREDGFFECEKEDFLDADKYIWWQSL
jgi:hypothetical protein